MFRKMPLLLLALIIAISLLDKVMPLEIKSLLYAISLSIKSCIIFVLPFIIFALLFKTAVQLSSQATKIILFILAAVCCSNFTSTFLSHYVGAWIYHFNFSVLLPQNTQDLLPTWSFELPKLIANAKAMAAGIILGIGGSLLRPQLCKQIANKLDQFVHFTLRIITYFIPLFVAGFVVKLNYDGSIKLIVHNYALIFAVIFIAQFTYITFLYFLANNFKMSALWKSLKNMLPAAIAGFSTMSSAAAMPLTLVGTAKNTQNSELAKASIPATVNIHLMGDCFAIPILAYAVLKNYGVPEPLLFNYLIFALYFVLAKFSVAAVPGGGILVMLPILESYLGFNSEMLSLITALYILFDPVITSANVLGNGGFALLVEKGRVYLTKKKTVLETSLEKG